MTEDPPPDRPAHHFANAVAAGAGHHGWFLGHFMEPPDHPLLRSADVELKWGVHRKGERRRAIAAGDAVHAISLLVEGRFVLEFADREHVLARPGDFVVWSPGVAHSWRVEEDCVVLTVRWPSRPTADDGHAPTLRPPAAL